MAGRDHFMEEQLRHQAMAVGDMIKQLKDASQNRPGIYGGNRGRGSQNKRQPQKYRGQRGGYSPQPWQRPSPGRGIQRSSYSQRDEFYADRLHNDMEAAPYRDEFSRHCDNSIASQNLVLSLTEFPGFSATLLQLMEQKNFSPMAVRQVAGVHHQTFCLSDEKVVLKPKMSVCTEYLAQDGCQNRSACRNLHICPKFVSGTCDDKNCFLGHSWNTNHNNTLLESLSLEQVPTPQLHTIFMPLCNDTKPKGVLEICLPYNTDGCKQNKCKELHACLRFVVGYTKCKDTKCPLNHDILNQDCCHLLKTHGFSTNEAPRDITRELLAVNPSLIEKMKIIEKGDSSAQDPSKDTANTVKKDISEDLDSVEKDTKGESDGGQSSSSSDSEKDCDMNEGESDGDVSASSDNDNSDNDFKKEKDLAVITSDSVKEKGERNESSMTDITGDREITPKPIRRRTLWSHYLQGDVLIPEICYYSVESMCQNEASGCPRLHATQHYQWQVSEQGKRWLNLRSAQATCLERAFCNVAEDGVDLSRLDPATVEYSVSGLLILMGRDTWLADFKAMTLTNSTDTKRLFIRRLCTEIVEGQAIKAASFVWSFMDKNQKWVKYGNVDTAGESSLVSSATSNDIEKHYLQNSSAPLNFNNSKFSYVIDFTTMVQTNQKTQVRRELRRRPECHLEEEETMSEENRKDSELPLNWDSMQPEERMRLVPLAPSSQEYQTVVNLLAGKLASNIVTKIERVQNPFLWRALQNKIKEMTAVYGDATKVDIRQIFHGTGHTVVSSICTENFDWRLHGSSTGQMYGRGTYFSTDVKYSYNYCRPDANGVKHMFVARVAVGAITVGDSSMARPPINPATNAPFDSTVDNASNVTILVKYDKQEYYPEYILTLT